MLKNVLQKFGLNGPELNIVPFGSGLINHTWKIIYNTDSAYILQRINHNVFKAPQDIAYNVRLIGSYLSQHNADYFFVRNIFTHDGEDIYFVEGEGYFRLVPFVKQSHTVDVVQTPGQAFEAAKQFGKFTHVLSDFPVSQLKVTIPDFHNLTLRYHQFLQALETGNRERIEETKEEISWLQGQQYIVQRYEAMKNNPDFKVRVTHHDTKISNVLFDDADKGICVIDLDTVMPGYFTSDVGDMMRTCLPPVSEEEKDFSKIYIRDDYYKAIVQGYSSGIGGDLSEAEQKSFFDGGCYLIYMQALRFLADYINNDIYYGSKYPGHNLIRAKNQVVLLQKLLEKEETLRKIV